MAGFLRSIFGVVERYLATAKAAFTGPKDRPDVPSAEALCMAPKWQLISDVMEGHDAIKAGRERYLPRYENESETNYRRRLCDAPWRPVFPSALEFSLTSRPFGKPVTTRGEVSPRMQALIEDVDACGSHLSVFSRRVFNVGTTYGLAAVLVDFTRQVPRLDGRPLTLADERAAGARPYWTLINPRDLLEILTEFRNGAWTIVRVRLRECSTVADGYAQAAVERYRVIELDSTDKVHWTLYEKVDSAVVEVAGGDMTIGVIPLSLFFVGERKGGMDVQPWSLDLAHTALEYYRTLARTSEIETFSGWPMLVGKGIAKPADGGIVQLGPSTVLYAGGETADWKLIGPDASLVEQVAKSPERVLEAFSKLALEPVIPRSGVTASASQIDNSRANSSIEAWAGSLKDTLDLCLEFTALWLGEAATVTAHVDTDFIAQGASTEEAQVLAAAQTRGVISGETERAELKRRGILSPDWLEEAELARLAYEQDGLEGETLIDPVTGRVLIAPLTTNAQTASAIAKQAQDETRQRMQETQQTQILKTLERSVQATEQLARALTAPKHIVTDAKGNPVGIEVDYTIN